MTEELDHDTNEESDNNWFESSFEIINDGFEDDDNDEELNNDGLISIWDILNNSIKIKRKDGSDQIQPSMNVLTIKHIKSVLSTYKWQINKDIPFNKNIIVYNKNKYVAIIETKITIELSVLKSDNYKVSFYSDSIGKFVCKCETEQELNNIMEIIT